MSVDLERDGRGRVPEDVRHTSHGLAPHDQDRGEGVPQPVHVDYAVDLGSSQGRVKHFVEHVLALRRLSLRVREDKLMFPLWAAQLPDLERMQQPRRKVYRPPAGLSLRRVEA